MRGNTKNADTTHELPELVGLNIDSWVKAISAMDDIEAVRDEAYKMVGETFDENKPLCPAELEDEFTELAEKYKFRFDKHGRIVSYDLKANGHK